MCDEDKRYKYSGEFIFILLFISKSARKVCIINTYNTKLTSSNLILGYI
jgi:hypothetical protein